MECTSPCESGVRLMHCKSPCASGVRRMKCELPGAALRHKHCESPCASGVRRKERGSPSATDEMLRIPMRVRGATPEMRISRSDSATHVLQNPHCASGVRRRIVKNHVQSPCASGVRRKESETRSGTATHTVNPHARPGCDARNMNLQVRLMKSCGSPCASGVRRKKCETRWDCWIAKLRIPMRVRGATQGMQLSFRAC